jgi:TPR repeat protein
MNKSCPSCKSFNARRSAVRTSEITLRHVFMSPYRCRDCRARFWVLSKNSYYVAGVLGMFVVLLTLAWNAGELLDLPKTEAGGKLAEKGAAQLPDLLKLAESADPSAEYELSRMYAIGEGVAPSLSEEHKWLERAARHGHVDAQYEYGVALRDGHGTVQDYQAARTWLQVAAERSNASAQFALGQLYRTGLGTPIDNVKAYIWLNVAAAQGVPGATGARDSVVSRLSQTELQDAQVESRRLSEQYNAKRAKPAE